MIFITGATGLVGSHIAYQLLKEGAEVKALKREQSDTSIIERHFNHYGGDKSLLNNIRWFNGDLLDILSLCEEMQGCSSVIHAAAYVSFYPGDREKLIKYNIEGTANMVNAALDCGIEDFGFISSTAAIGRGKKNRGNETVTEETKWVAGKKTSNYALSKHYAEREVWRGMEEGLRVFIVNPCIVTGPGNWHQSSAEMFTTTYKGLKFYTSGSNAFVDARDVAEILLRIMKEGHSGKRFLTIGENMSYRDYFTLIAKKLNVDPPEYAASKFLTGIAWRLEKIRSLITGNTPLITRDTVRSSQSNVTYSNRRILNTLPDFRFTPIETAVENAAERFLKER